MIRHIGLRRFVSVVLFCCAVTVAAHSQSQPSIRIVSDQAILANFEAQVSISGIHLLDVTQCPSSDGSFNCSSAENQAGISAAPPIPCSSLPSGRVSAFKITCPAGSLLARRAYELRFLQAADPKSAPKPTSITFSTVPEVSIQSEGTNGLGYSFQISSPLAFVDSNGHIMVFSNSGAPDSTPVTIPSDKAGTIHGRTAPLSSFTATDSAHADAHLTNEYGVLRLSVDKASLKQAFSPSTSSAAAILVAFKSVLDCLAPGSCSATSWKFADGSKLSPPTPATKSDAQFYANINAIAGTGSKFAWGLNGTLGMFSQGIGKSRWVVTPASASASVGNNTSNIKSQSYSDTIDWNLPFSIMNSRGWNSLCLNRGAGYFSAAPDYSTDIEFDRKNLLADIHMACTLVSDTLERQSKPVKGAPAAPGSYTAKFGGELQFQYGIETGGALIDTTQKASSGTAKMTVPAYKIGRDAEQIHGLLQWQPSITRSSVVLSLDDVFTGRYLFATENTVEQYTIPASGATASTLGLLLRPRTGWMGYNVLTATITPTGNPNTGFTVTYDDGFNAPKFTRINSVTIGITLMY
jgi:hypothetical protein